jgi:hypothetical protein
LTTPSALKLVKEEQQQPSSDKKPQPSSHPLTSIQAKSTTILSQNHLQAAGNLKFKQEPKNSDLTKTLRENVETTTTASASTTVTGTQTFSNLKSKGSNIILV